MRLPKISFIVPVYNVEKYVGKCLESILTQISVFPRSEIIIVNDGSNDDSMKVVEEYTFQYDFISIINQKNSGLSMARNHGEEAATGDYIWFVDSDDWLESNALQVLRSTMKVYPGMDVYATGLRWVNDEGEIKRIDIRKMCDKIMSGMQYVDRLYPTGATPRFIIRHRLLQNAGLKFISGVLHEDTPYGLMLAYQAKSVVLLPEAIYAYRQRSESIMHSLKIRSAYDLVIAHKKLIAFCQEQVKTDDRIWFCIHSWNIFNIAFMFTKHLFYTTEFNEFMKNNWDYIKQQTMDLFPYLPLHKRIKMKFFISYPKLFIFLSKIKSDLLFTV
ncbi:glycosyltransferase family 2 protein [Phocaeicola sp.]